MDSSHVALVSLNLSSSGFKSYRAASSMTLGLSIAHLAKVMKLVNNNDEITLKAEAEPSHLTIICVNQSKSF